MKRIAHLSRSRRPRVTACRVVTRHFAQRLVKTFPCTILFQYKRAFVAGREPTTLLDYYIISIYITLPN